jgi:hypothetical protein
MKNEDDMSMANTSKLRAPLGEKDSLRNFVGFDSKCFIHSENTCRITKAL